MAMLGLALLTLPVVYFKVQGLVADSYYVFLSPFIIGAFGYPFLYYLSQRVTYSDYHRRVPYIFGVIAYSMGLSVSNTKAIIEGWFDLKHIFTRTPKSGGENKTYGLESRSIIPYLEILIGLYVFTGLIYVIVHTQLILIPFLLLYAVGFLCMGFSSIRNQWFTVKAQEVLCSRENS
jgi:hypothetical protein